MSVEASPAAGKMAITQGEGAELMKLATTSILQGQGHAQPQSRRQGEGTASSSPEKDDEDSDDDEAKEDDEESLGEEIHNEEDDDMEEGEGLKSPTVLEVNPSSSAAQDEEDSSSSSSSSSSSEEDLTAFLEDGLLLSPPHELQKEGTTTEEKITKNIVTVKNEPVGEIKGGEGEAEEEGQKKKKHRHHPTTVNKLEGKVYQTRRKATLDETIQNAKQELEAMLAQLQFVQKQLTPSASSPESHTSLELTSATHHYLKKAHKQIKKIGKIISSGVVKKKSHHKKRDKNTEKSKQGAGEAAKKVAAERKKKKEVEQEVWTPEDPPASTTEDIRLCHFDLVDAWYGKKPNHIVNMQQTPTPAVKTEAADPNAENVETNKETLEESSPLVTDAPKLTEEKPMPSSSSSSERNDTHGMSIAEYLRQHYVFKSGATGLWYLQIPPHMNMDEEYGVDPKSEVQKMTVIQIRSKQTGHLITLNVKPGKKAFKWVFDYEILPKQTSEAARRKRAKKAVKPENKKELLGADQQASDMVTPEKGSNDHNNDSPGAAGATTTTPTTTQGAAAKEKSTNTTKSKKKAEEKASAARSLMAFGFTAKTAATNSSALANVVGNINAVQQDGCAATAQGGNTNDPQKQLMLSATSGEPSVLVIPKAAAPPPPLFRPFTVNNRTAPIHLQYWNKSLCPNEEGREEEEVKNKKKLAVLDTLEETDDGNFVCSQQTLSKNTATFELFATDLGTKNTLEAATKVLSTPESTHQVVDVEGYGLPESFRNEVSLISRFSTNYQPVEARPAYYGTWNSTIKDLFSFARFSRGVGEMPRVTAEQMLEKNARIYNYEEDTGDDWDSENQESDCEDLRSNNDVGSSSAGSSDKCSDYEDFIDDDDEQIEFEDEEDREEHRNYEKAQKERKALRKQGGGGEIRKMEPVIKGPFVNLQLSEHLMASVDFLRMIRSVDTNAFTSLVEAMIQPTEGGKSAKGHRHKKKQQKGQEGGVSNNAESTTNLPNGTTTEIGATEGNTQSPTTPAAPAKKKSTPRRKKTEQQPQELVLGTAMDLPAFLSEDMNLCPLDIVEAWYGKKPNHIVNMQQTPTPAVKTEAADPNAENVETNKETLEESSPLVTDAPKLTEEKPMPSSSSSSERNDTHGMSIAEYLRQHYVFKSGATGLWYLQIPPHMNMDEEYGVDPKSDIQKVTGLKLRIKQSGQVLVCNAPVGKGLKCVLDPHKQAEQKKTRKPRAKKVATPAEGETQRVLEE